MLGLGVAGGYLTPRPPRFLPVGVPVHVTNRGNDRRQVFFQEADYRDFIALLRDGLSRCAVDVFGYNTMPNHFHIVLGQREPGAISAYLHRVTCLTACNLRWSTSSAGMGHVFQRRFWSKVIAAETEFRTVLKYVEANALRAGLVQQAEQWEWGSLSERMRPVWQVISHPPVPLPEDWCQLVNRPLPPSVLAELRSRRRPGRSRATHIRS